MRCALAVPAATACLVLFLAATCLAGEPAAAATQPGQTDLSLPVLPEPASAIPEPPAGAQPPLNIDTPPAFIKRPAARPRPARPDLTFAQKSAPADFRGLPWGAELSRQAGLLPVTKPVTLAGTYFRPDELLRLGQAEIRSVAYYFPKGKLTGVGIVFVGQENFFLIKDHLIDLYGPGRQMGDRYGWTWSNFFIDLRMREALGELRYQTQP
ncbi:MAG: hypothetical protein KKF77_16835 [Proteobacteria bacterium]|nr:hypothetical protein [Pseudomonadota bacterium]